MMRNASNQDVPMYNSDTVNRWVAAVCGGGLAFCNYLVEAYTLNIINYGELIGKIVTAGLVGFVGAGAGVLGKMFISWSTKRVKKFFNHKPSSK